MIPAELIAQRRQTRAFIQVNPVLVQFVRKVRVSDGAGGHTFVTVDKPEQKVRIDLVASRANVERRTEAGVLVQANAVMVGYPGLDVQKYDTFTWQGGNCEVLFVDPNADYQVSVEVLYSNG